MNIVSSQITSFVYSAEEVQGETWLPIRVLSTIHWCWRWNYKRKIYTDSNNWVPLTLGSLANKLIKDDSWLRTVAHIILITHRTKLYVQQVNILNQQVRKFSDALRGRYGIVPRIDWEKGPVAEWKYKLWLRRVRIIQVTFFRLVVQLYTVAMHAVDVYDAFHRRHEAFDEVFINANECLQDFMKNRDAVMKYCRDNEKTLQKVWEQCQGFSQTKIINILDKII